MTPSAEPLVNILLVDDQEANLLALEAVLQPLGQNLVKVASGEDALRWLLDHDPAVILMDVRMPGLDGYETARLLRGRERSRHTPILFLTAHEAPEFPAAKAYTLGAVDYLVMPVAPEVLRAKVDVFVQLFQRTEQVRQLERRESEHWLAEESLRRFRAIIEHSYDAIALLAADGTIRYFSPLKTSQGGGFAAEELLGRSAFEYIHPDDLARVQEQFARLLQLPGGSIAAQYRSLHKDGSWLWIEGTGTNLLHEPSVQAIVVNYRDITERQRATEALRESEQRFVWFMQHLPGLAWIKDVQGRYVFANDAAERAFRTPRAELYGKTDDQVFPPETAARFQENDRRALASGAGVRVIETLEHEDGTLRHSVVSKFPIPGPDGKPALVGGMAIDITDRLRAEEELRLSEEQFHRLADSIPQLAWMARPDGHIYWYNQRWYEYTGTTLERMEGWGWQSVHDPQELPKVLERWKASLATGEPFDMVLPLRGADGVFRPFLTRVMPRRSKDGRILHWFGTNTDVTQQTEMEKGLREAARQKDAFLAMLAHELRNPLAPLANGLHILRRPETTPQVREQTREMMGRQVCHLTRLVDDLLDMSRIMRGKVRLRKERLDLGRLARTTAEDRRPVLEKAGLDLLLETPQTPVWVLGDATRLAQILTNLLDNAAKFAGRGRKVTVRVAADAARHQALLSVRDQGIGIEPEMLPRLFSPFTQADKSLDRSRGGLGLGLSLVKGLAELHGGGVGVASEGPEKGAEFTVRLPLEQEPTGLSELPEIPSHPRPAGKHLRILLVEDNKDAANSLRILLELLGHEVRLAYTGPAGVAAAREWRPDLVLCDIGLPGLDGYGVARALRRDPATARTRLLALTGYGQDEDKRRSREAGFDYHLVKPADPEELQRLLASG